jgi:hypothetical protein
MIKSLKELTKTGKASADDLTSLQKHVAALRHGVSLANLGPEAEAQLASLFKLSDGALNSITSHRILNSLSFPEMHRRLDRVGKAYSETFEWIFEDEPQKQRKALEGRMLFTKWLESGNGIFHIAGKPGAGKSTLMKFLYKHPHTTDLLDHWAAGRKLVLGKFFFWKPGFEMENSVTGLLRTLLYETIEQCPELASSVFPRQWSQVEALPWQAPVELHLDGDEIREAFTRLMENRNLPERRCFCFFIDGLDEFQETREEGYKELTQLLSSWTRTAPGDLKLCVSSREFDVFLDHFSGPQGLKLQDLTYDDIHQFVREKLEGNEKFLNLEKPKNGGEELISQVTDRADGVFLWVALVVKLLDDACDDEDQFSDLQRKVESTPQEVKDLFQQLFDSIRESDRDQSAQIFAIVLRLLESKWGLRLSLFRYSLLDHFHADPEFASKTNFQEQGCLIKTDDMDVKLRLKRARKQLYKCCKGLLEVQELEDDPLGGTFEGTHLKHRISLAHRSVHEFLFKKEIEQERSARLQGFDIFGAICQTFVAEVASLDISDFNDLCYAPELVDILLGISQRGSGAGRYIKALHNLDRIMSQHEPEDHPELSFCSRDKGPTVSCFRDNFSVAHCAATFGVHQYFTSDLQSSFVDDATKNGSLALSVIYGPASPYCEEYSQCGWPMVLRWIFQRGCCPNQAAEWNSNMSLWQIFVSRSLNDSDMLRTANGAEVTQIFLESGADPDISVSAQSDERHTMTMHSPPPTRTTTIVSSFRFKADTLSEDIFDFVNSKGGQATLRDIIEFLRPANVETLLALIDGKSQAQQRPATSSADSPLLSSDLEAKTTPIQPLESKTEAIDVPDDDTLRTREKVVGMRAVVWLKLALGNPLFTFTLGKIIHRACILLRQLTFVRYPPYVPLVSHNV